MEPDSGASFASMPDSLELRFRLRLVGKKLNPTPSALSPQSSRLKVELMNPCPFRIRVRELKKRLQPV